jgi:hypothetical protein
MKCKPQSLAYFVNTKEKNSEPSGLMTAQGGMPSMINATPYMMYASNRGPNPCKGCNKTVLNPEMGIKRSVCFDKRGCGYTRTQDGRLRDARMTYLELDAPPHEGDVGYMGNVYSNKLKNYSPRIYNGYKDITTGQLEYYQDSVLAGPYPNRTGNWAIRSDEDSFIYQNPMGVREFQAERYQATAQRPEYLCGQNFMKDSMSHREDLMSKQLHQLNKNSFNARYGPKYSKVQPHQMGEKPKPVQQTC